MESPQQVKAGAPKGGPKGKMKRCPYCGAKNKASFEYCIRCAEPLDDSAAAGREELVSRDSGTLSKILVGGILGVVALLVVALVVRGRNDSAASASAPAPAGGAPDLATRPVPELPASESKEVLAKFNNALAAYNQKDYRAAVDLFEEVIQEIPENPSAHQYLGLAHYQLGEFADALEDLQSARDLRPDSFQLLDHYVTIAKKAGDLEKAEAALLDYIGRNPDETEPRLELSRIARTLGKADEALEQAAYLANAQEASPEFKYEYGVSLKEAGKLEEAKAALKSSLELDPSSAAANHALGVTELLSGKPQEAVAPLEAAVARAPDNGDFRFSLAQAYEKLDRIPESLAAYEAYLQHAGPSDPRAKVVRERLEVAKKALAERNQASEGRKGQSS
jgi:predicted Zn-dependent protease